MNLKPLYFLIIFLFSLVSAAAPHCENPTNELHSIKDSIRKQIRASLVKAMPVPEKMICRTAKRFVGEVSFYGKGDGFAGKKTASGKKFNPLELTAAHKTLPFGTRIQVINEKNNRSVFVTITDRGPYAKDRVLDLSHHAAELLDFEKTGTAQVTANICHSGRGI